MTLKIPFSEVTRAARPSLASKHAGHAPEDECFNTDIPLGLLIHNVAPTLILQIQEYSHTQRTNVSHTEINLQQWATYKFPNLTQ